MRYQAGMTPKKIIIIVTSCVLAVLLVVGIVVFAANSRTANATVDAERVSMYSTQYWGDEATTGGMVSSDFVQELYPETDKAISELFVKEGQTVKIGDKLLQYDTTKLELTVESNALEVQKKTHDRQQASKELLRLKNTTPYVEPTPPPVVPDPTPTPPPVSEAELYDEITLSSKPFRGTGTADDPYVYLCTADCVLSKDFLMRLFGLDSFSASPTPTPTAEPTAEPSAEPTAEPTAGPTAEPTAAPTAVPTAEPTAEPTVAPTAAPTTTPDPTDAPVTESMAFFRNLTTTGEDENPDEVFEIGKGPFVARFEVHEEDNEKLPLIKGWLMDGNAISGSFFTMQEDITDGVEVMGLDEDDPSVSPLPDGEGMYTADELKSMIARKEQEIKDLDIAIKQANINLSKAELALKNATVLATVNGTVKTIIDLDTALTSSSPFLVVSGGEGFYVSGTLNEMMIGSVNVGDTLMANSWETGTMYTAEIVKISDFPTENSNYWGGSQNPNSSNYTFTAFIAEGEGLKNGSYLDITLQANAGDTAQSDTLYLFKAYIRSDDNGKYVLKVGDDGRVHKTYIKTGKTIYNSYLEIKGGELTLEDYIAFPYGTNAIEGAKANLPEDALPNEEDLSV